MSILTSLVIPTFNRANLLEKALASVAAAVMPKPDELEVIVVDNNSTDNTAEIVKRASDNFPCQLRYIKETTQGSSAARNSGVKDARGHYVAFMDNDQIMEPHYFENIGRAFAETGAVCVGGPVTYYNAENLPRWLYELSKTIGQIDFGDQTRILGPDTHKGLGGGNVVFIRSELVAIGGFNVRLGHRGNDLMTLGDLEIQDRLRGNGKTVGYSPLLIQYHYLRPERFKKSYWREYYYDYGRSAYIRSSIESGSEHRPRFRIPVWLWRHLITRDVPAYLASFLSFDSYRQFRKELEIWTRMGQIHEANKAYKASTTKAS